MRNTLKILSLGTAAGLLGTIGALGQNYVLDNGTISTALNASDSTESRDNWFANEFTAKANANTLTQVQFACFTTTPGSTAEVVLYQVTDPGGNPALGATRVFTESFTPPVGNGTNGFMATIPLTAPVSFAVGSQFLVAIFVPNVIAAPPNDVYPFLLDTGTSAAGSYWDRGNPNSFNLDNIQGAVPINQVLAGANWDPGTGHMMIRATGVPEPSAAALLGLAALSVAVYRRRGN